MAWTHLRLLAAIALIFPLSASRGLSQDAASDTNRASPEQHQAAEEHFLRGRYEEAASAFRKLPFEPDAAIGLARCAAARGEMDQALATLRSAAAEHPAVPPLHAELALLGLEMGDLKLAREQASLALKHDPHSLPAGWVKGETLRLTGKLEEAEQTFAGLIDRQRQLAARGAPIDAWSLHWIGLAAAQHARWTRNHKMFNSLVNELVPAALRADKNFWPAHLQSAVLFHEKYNEPEALASLAAGLAINPNAADLHAARAAIAVRSFDVAAATSAIARAQEINPRHVGAGQLAADVNMINTDPAAALEVLEKVLPWRPGDEQTVGRMVACLAVLDGGSVRAPSERMAKLIDAAAKQNPHSGELFLAAGDALDRMRRYATAAEFYRESQQRMPQLTAARSQLGMTLMRLGNETEAAQILEDAFAADPFHVRVKNTLEVLDLLQGYAVLETEHFVLKFDRGQDELLARYAAKHLEQHVYPEVVQTLGFEPPEKTLIEIFSRARSTSGHGWFSARMVGLPAIGTVGACAGKMVAIATPRELPKKYNWAKVLGHEFVHVVNLQQTDFGVPHWLTEGIAVHLEDQPRPEEWNTLLAKRNEAGDLFTLENIFFGFVRPQRKEDWTLAYCQAELYVDYARENYGEEAIARLLAAYGERLTTEQALRKAFDVSQRDFEAGYRKFVAQIVSEQERESAEAAPDLERALQDAAARDQDAGAAAAVAVAYLARDDKPRARRWADQAIEIEKSHPAANYVLARLQLSIGDTQAALQLLERAFNKEHPHPASLALLARIATQRGDFDAAESYYTLGKETFPGSDRWAKGLASIYLKRGNEEKLLPILTELAEADPDNTTMRRKLARSSLQRKDYPSAQRWATELIHRDVEDAEAHRLLAEALKGLGDEKGGAEELAVAEELTRK